MENPDVIKSFLCPFGWNLKWSVGIFTQWLKFQHTSKQCFTMPQSNGETGCCKGNVLAGLRWITNKYANKYIYKKCSQTPKSLFCQKTSGQASLRWPGVWACLGLHFAGSPQPSGRPRAGESQPLPAPGNAADTRVRAACPRDWKRRALLRVLGRLPHRQPAGRPHFPTGAEREGSRREGRGAEPPRRASCSQQRREPLARPPAKVSRGWGKCRPRRSGREEVWRRPAAAGCNDSGAGSSGGPRSGRGTPACRRTGAVWGERGSPAVTRAARGGASDGGRGRCGWRRYVAVEPRVRTEAARTACCLHGNAAVTYVQTVPTRSKLKVSALDEIWMLECLLPAKYAGCHHTAAQVDLLRTVLAPHCSRLELMWLLLECYPVNLSFWYFGTRFSSLVLAPLCEWCETHVLPSDPNQKKYPFQIWPREHHC